MFGWKMCENACSNVGRNIRANGKQKLKSVSREGTLQFSIAVVDANDRTATQNPCRIDCCDEFARVPLSSTMSQEAELLASLVSDLKARWLACEVEHPEVFRYKLNVTKEKTLDGNFKFYVQVS